MRQRTVILTYLVLVIAFLTVAKADHHEKADATPDWSFNATLIEACSCPMFCQCYFNTMPANHAGHAEHTGHEGAGHAEHFCRANIAFKVNTGHYGDVKLDGIKFWAAGDLGDDFGDGEIEWLTVIFDKSMTQEQRDALGAIMPHVYPFKIKSFTTSEGTIDQWHFDKDTAVATVDGGKTAEIRLKRFPGMTDEPIVIKNLVYTPTTRNDGFVLMPNEVEAYRVGDKAFEFKGTNGFMITIEASSKDQPAPPDAKVIGADAAGGK